MKKSGGSGPRPLPGRGGGGGGGGTNEEKAKTHARKGSKQHGAMASMKGLDKFLANKTAGTVRDRTVTDATDDGWDSD